MGTVFKMAVHQSIGGGLSRTGIFVAAGQLLTWGLVVKVSLDWELWNKEKDEQNTSCS